MASFILKSFIIAAILLFSAGAVWTFAYGYTGQSIILGLVAYGIWHGNRAIFGSHF